MSRKIIGATLAGLVLAASQGAVGPAPAAVQQYYPGPGIYCLSHSEQCWPIAYQREIYSDAGHTDLIGSGTDSCTGTSSMVYVSSPNLPAGYEVKTALYLCTPSGPYDLPAGWDNPPA